MPFEPIVDQNKCKGCEECLEVCTTGVFEIRDGKYLSLSPEKCTGCELCAMDCPSGAIDLMVLYKKAKRFVFCYHLDRCTFCAQCVQSCRHGCLELSADDWELASLSREAFTLYYGEDKDVREALAGTASPDGSGPSNS